MTRATLLGLLLAGCSPAPEPTNDAMLPNGTEGGALQPDAEAQGEAATENIANGTVPTAPRYVGRWAASKALCRDGAWKFAELDLSTAGEVSCDFHRVREVPGGYDVDATCLAEGSKSEETIEIRFAESAGAMLVESKTFRPVGLVRCEED